MLVEEEVREGPRTGVSSRPVRPLSPLGDRGSCLQDFLLGQGRWGFMQQLLFFIDWGGGCSGTLTPLHTPPSLDEGHCRMLQVQPYAGTERLSAKGDGWGTQRVPSVTDATLSALVLLWI